MVLVYFKRDKTTIVIAKFQFYQVDLEIIECIYEVDSYHFYISKALKIFNRLKYIKFTLA